MKEDTKNSANYVFLTSHNKPLDWQSLAECWVGIHNKYHNQDGVIEKLAREKKIRFYLKPYATRHSFITWQLKEGQTPANVALLVGNSAEMIYKHYVSADDDIKVVYEF